MFPLFQTIWGSNRHKRVSFFIRNNSFQQKHQFISPKSKFSLAKRKKYKKKNLKYSETPINILVEILSTLVLKIELGKLWFVKGGFVLRTTNFTIPIRLSAIHSCVNWDPCLCAVVRWNVNYALLVC